MPGGFVPDLSEASRLRIKSACPLVDIEAVQSSFQYHYIVIGHDQQTGREVRDKLSAIAEQAVKLRVEMQTLSEEARNALWDALGIYDGPAFKQGMIEGLTRLSGASRAAHNATELRGKTPSKWYSFVRDIAAILATTGVEVNSSRRGPLYQVIRILRGEFSDGPTHISPLIKNALEKLPAKA